uniref:MPN domain-containing protein n=1 Tax=Aegilops tauschii subsp. strangulata TaxID=200361 RepID=A0A453EPM0_AEGTS
RNPGVAVEDGSSKAQPRKKTPSSRSAPLTPEPNRTTQRSHGAAAADLRRRRDGPAAVGLAAARLLRAGLHLLPRPPQDAQAREGRRADGGHGPHARRVRRRLHGPGGRRLRHAAERDRGQRRGRRPRLPDQYARHAQADRQRPEMVVGWYHSHPGFGCWLSGVDINTQQSFEALNPRAVAVVIDPIQSVKGKVVIDAFRLINPQTMMLGQEPRQTTSNVGHLNKPSIQALIHGLNRHYYSIAINYRKNELEEKMLLNLHKKKWTDGLILKKFDAHSETNEQTVQEMLSLAIKYNKAVQEEDELSPEKLAIANVGRQDAKKHLEEHVSNLMSSNIVQTLAIFMGVL